MWHWMRPYSPPPPSTLEGEVTLESLESVESVTQVTQVTQVTRVTQVTQGGGTVFVFFMGGSMSRGSCAGVHGAKVTPYYI